MAGVKNNGQGHYVFGLDIGTRSVVGTVGYLVSDKFHVVAQFIKEHETRAMLDGQIHDIAKVSNTINFVKTKLEQKLNIKLSDVCIAAAGRVLKTKTSFAEISFDTDKVITSEDIYNLSTMGVDKAYNEFQKDNAVNDVKFYCVGYTPMRFYMNGYQIGNLEGHKCKKIGIDLIATFLPDDVVDGLYKAVESVGLKVVNLTLEPIAAIKVAIPEKYRMLNMALVDVGAGTSDVCITKDGTITAYGMMPLAGDSLTEAIVQYCLVDFDTAERIKRAADNEGEIAFTDIMGLSQTVDSAKIKELLAPFVKIMADKAADCIRELNGDKPVSAVFVVGGGGIVPGYTGALADALGIMKERVAVRGQEVMSNVVFEEESLAKKSLMVTPIGIALSYYDKNNNFIYVDFNGTRVKLYDNGKLNIADAAMAANFSNEDLFPKRGKALNYTVNGKPRISVGERGESCEISLNGKPADLYEPIHDSDHVYVNPSTAGDIAVVELGKLKEFGEEIEITVNGKTVKLPKTAEVNSKLENEYYRIQDGDIIEIRNYYTVTEIASLLDVKCGNYILINDMPGKPDSRVYSDFNVVWSDERIYDEPKNPNIDDKTEKNKDTTEVKEGVETTGINVIANSKTYHMSGKPSFVFVDIFDYINFDLKESKGRSIVTLLNGSNADYMAGLKDGDVIEIYWK